MISEFLGKNSDDATNCAVDNLAEIVNATTGKDFSDLAFKTILRNIGLISYSSSSAVYSDDNTFISALAMQATLQSYGLTYNGYGLTQEEIGNVLSSNQDVNVILNLKTAENIDHYVRITRNGNEIIIDGVESENIVINIENNPNFMNEVWERISSKGLSLKDSMVVLTDTEIENKEKLSYIDLLYTLGAVEGEEDNSEAEAKAEEERKASSVRQPVSCGRPLQRREEGYMADKGRI